MSGLVRARDLGTPQDVVSCLIGAAWGLSVATLVTVDFGDGQCGAAFQKEEADDAGRGEGHAVLALPEPRDHPP